MARQITQSDSGNTERFKQHSSEEPIVPAATAGAASLNAAARPPWHLLAAQTAVRGPLETVHRIHLPAGKGGAGKTTLTNLLASTTLNSGRHVEIYDLCSANPSARRLFKLETDRVRGSLDKHEIGDTFMHALYPHLETSSVIGDLGAAAEMPMLDFLTENELLDFLGEHLVFHVLVGPLDSIGTARSIATRAPRTPIILYLNHRDAELKMVVGDAGSSFAHSSDSGRTMGQRSIPFATTPPMPE